MSQERKRSHNIGSAFSSLLGWGRGRGIVRRKRIIRINPLPAGAQSLVERYCVDGAFQFTLRRDVLGHVGGALIDQDMQEIGEACLVQLGRVLKGEFAVLAAALAEPQRPPPRPARKARARRDPAR